MRSCKSHEARDGFPRFVQIRAKRMQCPTVYRWLERLDPYIDKRPAGKRTWTVDLMQGDDVAYYCDLRLRWAGNGDYLTGSCESADERRSFRFGAGS